MEKMVIFPCKYCPKQKHVLYTCNIYHSFTVTISQFQQYSDNKTFYKEKLIRYWIRYTS